MSLLIIRGGSEESVRLKLEDRLNRPAIGVEFTGQGFRALNFFNIMGGIIVVNVEPGSPADIAGLDEKDVILSIDGKRIPPERLPETIRGYDVGDRITVEILREGNDDPTEIEVTLGENDAGDAYLGIGFTSAPMLRRSYEDLRDRFRRLREPMGLGDPEKKGI